LLFEFLARGGATLPARARRGGLQLWNFKKN